MPRGNAPQTKVHYQGKEDDFVIFVDDVEQVQKWKTDRSIPLAQVVSGFKIFVTHKHGAQNAHDEASKQTLDTEFGTSNEDECMIRILEQGTMQASEVGLHTIDTAREMTSAKTIIASLESVQGPKTTAWELVQLIER